MFVSGLDDDRWLSLTHRTLTLTGGTTDYGIEISRRCAEAQDGETGLQVMALLVDQGEPWEQSYVRDRAIDLLRRSSSVSSIHAASVGRTRDDHVGELAKIPPSTV